MTSAAALPRSENGILTDIRSGAYDFIDFGSSAGGSLGYCMKRFNAARGVGIDLDPAKVARTRERGFDCIQGNLLTFDCLPRCFRFASMMDFLEHLPDAASVEQAIARARDIARDFIFIRHPSFDDMHYLETLGLKQYWTHWRGHTARLPVAEFACIFQRLGLRQYVLNFRKPALDSADPVILPLSAPLNEHLYDPARHEPKPLITFPRPLYGQIDMLIALRQMDADDWAHIATPRD